MGLYISHSTMNPFTIRDLRELRQLIHILLLSLTYKRDREIPSNNDIFFVARRASSSQNTTSTTIIVSFPEHLNGTNRQDMAISLQSQQPLGYTEIIDGLRNSKQRRYDDHSASTALKERCQSLVFKCLRYTV